HGQALLVSLVRYIAEHIAHDALGGFKSLRGSIARELLHAGASAAQQFPLDVGRRQGARQQGSNRQSSAAHWQRVLLDNLADELAGAMSRLSRTIANLARRM